MEMQPSGGGGISRGGFGASAGGGSRPSSGGRGNTSMARTLLEYTKSLYTDQYRWSCVKGFLFFAAGVVVAREFAQIDFDEVVMSPPPS